MQQRGMSRALHGRTGGPRAGVSLCLGIPPSPPVGGLVAIMATDGRTWQNPSDGHDEVLRGRCSFTFNGFSLKAQDPSKPPVLQG